VVGVLVGFIVGSVFFLPQASAAWPEKPITIVVPFAPGGGTDTLTRILADELSRQTGHTFVVENKAGAMGTIAAKYVAGSAPDGHTYLMGTGGVNVLSRILMKEVTFDTTKALRGVSMIAGMPNVLVINPSVPARTVEEFIAHAKANPKKLNFGASGSGSRMAMELFLHKAGIEMTMIPYRGSAPAIQDLLKGDIHALTDILVSLEGMIKSGKLIGLALTGEAPWDTGMPTLEEVGIEGATFVSWQGVFAPKETPTVIVEKFSEHINQALMTEEVKKKIKKRGANIMAGTPEQMDNFVQAEIVKLEAVAKAANIVPTK
jgi:tripartite-type tricarboxylate transporter receptor subunit TctC